MKDVIFDIKELGFIPPRYGGVSVSIARLIQRLTNDGFVVGGFYTDENQDTRVLQSELYDAEPDFSLKRLPSLLFNNLRIFKPYRIVHSHYSLEHMFYVWCIVHFLRKKVVITVHNSMAQSYYKNCDFINVFFIKCIAKNKNVSWIAVSEQAKQEMLSLPVNFSQEIHVIPAYIPDTSVEKDTLPQSVEKYIKQHERIITFYGHSFMLHDGKDVYGFRDALTVYSKILEQTGTTVGLLLCLAEDKDKQKIEELHSLAKSLNIDDKVYWQIGPIKKMNAVWEETDVYIRPTCTDGDSVAVREALDMGVQVVASDVCARPAGTISYKYGDMADFVDKVLPALTKGKGEKRPDYSNYEAIKKIYVELLGK